jgi:integrase/recombinase XerD
MTDSGSRAGGEARVFDRQGSRKYLNDAERQLFLRAAENEGDAARRAFCLTLYYTGCRISEALNLTVERIDRTQRCLVFETLKRRRRGEFRAVPVPESLMTLLAEIQPEDEASSRVWSYSRPTAYRMVKACMEHAGIRGGMASPKGLRHAFAVACIARNIPLTTVRKWLGHARLETTAIYLGVSGDEERALARRLWESDGSVL